MKTIFLGVAAFIAAICFFTYSAKAQANTTPVPLNNQPGCSPEPGLPSQCCIADIFRIPNTQYNFSGSPTQCKSRCLRRSVSTWTQAEWDLYAQLWLQMNAWGWIEGLREGHALDNCSQNPATGPHFHFNETFFPWHRFFIAHFEQLMQKTDHIINPGRASRSGEFCLGYWDWGYQEPYSNDLTSATYKYIFGPNSLGTLPNGSNPVPDSRFRGAATNGSVLYRDPQVGQVANSTAPFLNSSWNSVVVSSCLSLTDYYGDGQPFFVPLGTDLATFNPPNRTNLSFWSCSEFLFHGAIHVAIGGFTGQMGNLSVSSAEPAFFLHHAMVDYVWWTWEHLAGKTYPAFFINERIAQPYANYTCGIARDWTRFCYDYVSNSNTVGGKAPYPGTVPTNYSSLPGDYKGAVDKVITQGQPTPIPYNTYKGALTMGSEELAKSNYQQYLAYLRLAQIDHANVVNTYVGDYKKAKGSTITPTTSPVKQGWGGPSNQATALNGVLGYS